MMFLSYCGTKYGGEREGCGGKSGPLSLCQVAKPDDAAYSVKGVTDNNDKYLFAKPTSKT